MLASDNLSQAIVDSIENNDCSSVTNDLYMLLNKLFISGQYDRELIKYYLSASRYSYPSLIVMHFQFIF